MTRDITGLKDIAALYQAMIVDQYGVLHDGKCAEAGARDALAQLVAMGIPVAVVTNSGKSADANRARLARFGFPAEDFAAVLTSGDVARARIAAMLDAGGLKPGAAVTLLSRDGDVGLIDGLPLKRVALGAQADLVLIAGLDPNTMDRATCRDALAPLARSGVPALCANPDRVSNSDHGPVDGPGVIAEDYRAAGGSVEFVGKPGSALFAAALAALGNPAPEACLMIGDSLEHDIAGAAALGIATLHVRGGVQSLLPGAVSPDYALGALCW